MPNVMSDSEQKKESKSSDTSSKTVLAEHSPVLRTIFRSHELMQEVRMYDRILPAAFLAGVLGALLWYMVFTAPPEFEAPAIVKVEVGATLEVTTQQFETAHTVRSAWTLKLLLRLAGANTRVQAGSYFFAAPQNLFTVARRLALADFELTPARIVVREGDTVQEIAVNLKKKLAPFDVEGLLNAGLPREGYLYPDTYYFLPGEDPALIVGVMEKNFRNHITPIQDKILKFGKPFASVVTMASILVGESATDTDRRTVAGILWKRMELGMPLQVDATFGYIFDKNLTQLTGADIRIDSPYNTYKNKGLPPTPINNPEAKAIEQTVTPIKSNYLYYLSDRRGNMYFSATYVQHKAKIRLYYGK